MKTNTTKQKTDKTPLMTVTPFTWNRTDGLITSHPLPQHVAVAAAAVLSGEGDDPNEVLEEQDRGWDTDGVDYQRSSTEATGQITYDAQHGVFVVGCDSISFEYYIYEPEPYSTYNVCYSSKKRDVDGGEWSEWSR